jgi:hypothetical protein
MLGFGNKRQPCEGSIFGEMADRNGIFVLKAIPGYYKTFARVGSYKKRRFYERRWVIHSR